MLTGLVTPQTSTSKRTAAGHETYQRRWHKLIDKAFADLLEYNIKLVGLDLAKKLMVYLVFNLDEESVNAMGKIIKVIGSKARKKHENQNGASRCSITMIRSGCPAPDPKDTAGPTFFLLTGTTCKPEYSQDFLELKGAAKYSKIIMTDNAYLTDEAWKQLCPSLTAGLRHKVRASSGNTVWYR